MRNYRVTENGAVEVYSHDEQGGLVVATKCRIVLTPVDALGFTFPPLGGPGWAKPLVIEELPAEAQIEYPVGTIVTLDAVKP